MNVSTVFFVAGVPVPKGSTRAFLHSKTKKIVTRQDNAEKQAPWSSAIGYAGQKNVPAMTSGPVSIQLQFIMPRTKSHFRTGKLAGTLKDDAPYYQTSKPDLDKLVRCVLDALTGIAWVDDAQVVEIKAWKRYGEQPGVLIEINQ